MMDVQRSEALNCVLCLRRMLGQDIRSLIERELLALADAQPAGVAGEQRVGPLHSQQLAQAGAFKIAQRAG